MLFIAVQNRKQVEREGKIQRENIYIYTHSAERVSSIAFSVRNRKARLAAACTG